MACSPNPKTPYRGYEIGPLRPPSEAESLLIRPTRNCSWNRCTFCPGYGDARFSIRPLAEVLSDIDRLRSWRELIEAEGHGETSRLCRRARSSPSAKTRSVTQTDLVAGSAMMRWMETGMRSVFLQDGNSMVIPPGDLLAILSRIRAAFPEVEQITSFGRSGTIARIPDADLAALAEAGLTHVQIGFESGSDRVLRELRKGATRDQHLAAAQKLSRAGIGFSVYLLWGAGGRELSARHAKASADLINAARPDVVRMVTLSYPPEKPLFANTPADYRPAGETDMVTEIRHFLTRLDPGPGTIESDFISNLLHGVAGPIDGGLPDMCGAIDAYLGLPAPLQDLFAIGKRMGLLSGLAEFPAAHPKITAYYRQLGLTPETVPGFLAAARARILWP